tara:strand:- start:9135 stop:9923 length:789 start_codon:yes stop_codon:yes gene_type:complete
MNQAPFATILGKLVIVYPDEIECPDCHRPKMDDHPDIVERLVGEGHERERVLSHQCECKARAEKMAADMLAASNLPNRGPEATPRTWDNFEGVDGATEAGNAAFAFARGASTETILALIGVAGSGKTHLVEAVGRWMLAKGQTVRYEYVSELLDEWRDSYALHSDAGADDIRDRLEAPRLLILDDLGQGKATPWVQEKLTAIVDGRYRMGGTAWRLLVTTNLTRGEVAVQLGERLADRLWDTQSGKVRAVIMTCDSYRSRRA